MMEKPNPDDVARLLQISKPFIQSLRIKWAAKMIETMPQDADKRENFYAMICGLNALERELTNYATPTPTPAEPDPSVEASWNGLPLEE